MGATRAEGLAATKTYGIAERRVPTLSQLVERLNRVLEDSGFVAGEGRWQAMPSALPTDRALNLSVLAAQANGVQGVPSSNLGYPHHN